MLIDWNEIALQAVVDRSLTTAYVLWLPATSIVRTGIRKRENPVAIRTDVQAAQTLGKISEPSTINDVAVILRAFSSFDAGTQLLEENFCSRGFCTSWNILAIPQVVRGIQTETDYKRSVNTKI